MEATYWFGTLVAQTVRCQIPQDLEFNLLNDLCSAITLPVIRFVSCMISTIFLFFYSNNYIYEKCIHFKHVLDLRFSPPCKGQLRSSGSLRGVDW
jgi:hypothetical protein